MKIVIVAGETSGDLLGGKLIQSLLKTDQELTISGIGGQTMRAHGMQTLYDVNETSVVGIVEVLRHYPKLRNILSKLKKHIATTKPSLLILIDYPEFNLKLATYAKKLGIKVLFYVSPQVWAWRTGRIKKIKQCVDLMAVLFPFEQKFYRKERVPNCLVRHPILDDVEQYFSRSTPNKSNKTRIGLLPGSRKSEIQRLLPLMLGAAKKLYAKNSNLEFIVPIAPGLAISELQKYNKYNLPITFKSGNIYQTIANCRILAVASGTATLQAALMGKAMVIVYKISPLTYQLFGHMVNVKHIGLANIILDKRIFTELIQNDANVSRLTDELEILINNQQLENKMQYVRETIYSKLSLGINSDGLAQLAFELVKKN